MPLTMFKIAPAMATGCTLVIKPSPETVLDAYLLAEAVEEAGVPAGVINIVPAGREVGAYLGSHPAVDKVAFTGSTAAGRAIAETCGRLLRPVTLELGGKSAAIVLDDADLAPERGAGVAHRVRTGTIGVNRYIPDPAAPFGGVKASGLGRELGPEGLAGYQQTQTVYL